MADRGIISFGGYLPADRLSRKAISDAHAWANPNLSAYGKSSRSMAHFDEDSITMAVEAATECLTHSASIPEVLRLASVTHPFADRSNAGIVRVALDLPEEVKTVDSGGSQRVGVGALGEALLGSGADLVVASHKSETRPASVQELTHGDGAVAIFAGEGDVLARWIGSEYLSADLVDHYRMSGQEFDYTLEERWIRDEGYLKLVPKAIARLFDKTGHDASDIDHFILQTTVPATASKVAKIAGIRDDAVYPGLFDRCGFAGPAMPLMALAEVLDKAGSGEKILIAGFGQGVELLLLETTDLLANFEGRGQFSALRQSGTEVHNYMQFLSFNGRIELDWGMRAERDERSAQSVAWRKSRDVYGFVGGKCRVCDAQQYPKSNVCINPECREINTQVPMRFAGLEATVKTFTEDWQALTPYPPLVYGNMAFDGGGNLLMEATNCGAGDLAVGARVRMAFRIKDNDQRRHFRRYFWKAVPIDGRSD